MTAPDHGRRRAIALIGAGVAAAVAGALTWRVGNDEQPAGAAATGTTAPPSTSTAPASTVPVVTTTDEPATTAPPQSSTGVPAAGVITVIGRDGWGAVPAGSGMVEHTVELLTVHHCAAVLEVNADAPDHIRGHQAFHMEDRGWPDLAYHFAIDAAGNVYQGRDPAMAGDTATDYDPTGHLLICCEGNFDVQPLPGPQRVALELLLAWGASTHRVGVDTIAGHGDYAATSCPGDAIRRLIDDGSLRRAVRDRLAAEPVTLDIVAGAAAVAAVEAVEQG